MILTLWLVPRRLAPARTMASAVSRSTIPPAAFTASETFDVGMDTASAVADAYFDKAPFAFEGELKRLHFENLPAADPGSTASPESD